MQEMIKYLKNNCYKNTYMVVQKDNYAFEMYLSVGFKIVDENSEEYIRFHYF